MSTEDVVVSEEIEYHNQDEEEKSLVLTEQEELEDKEMREENKHSDTENPMSSMDGDNLEEDEEEKSSEQQGLDGKQDTEFQDNTTDETSVAIDDDLEKKDERESGEQNDDSDQQNSDAKLEDVQIEDHDDNEEEDEPPPLVPHVSAQSPANYIPEEEIMEKDKIDVLGQGADIEREDTENQEQFPLEATDTQIHSTEQTKIELFDDTDQG